MNAILWGFQSFLAFAFLAAGTLKLVMPPAQLVAQGMDFVATTPLVWVRWLGVVEVAGALGLFVPFALRRFPGLTTAAAAGLALLMMGAVAVQCSHGNYREALVPLLLAAMASTVVWGRSGRWPLLGSSSTD